MPALLLNAAIIVSLAFRAPFQRTGFGQEGAEGDRGIAKGVGADQSTRDARRTGHLRPLHEDVRWSAHCYPE